MEHSLVNLAVSQLWSRNNPSSHRWLSRRTLYPRTAATTQLGTMPNQEINGKITCKTYCRTWKCNHSISYLLKQKNYQIRRIPKSANWVSMLEETELLKIDLSSTRTRMKRPTTTLFQKLPTAASTKRPWRPSWASSIWSNRNNRSTMTSRRSSKSRPLCSNVPPQSKCWRISKWVSMTCKLTTALTYKKNYCPCNSIFSLPPTTCQVSKRLPWTLPDYPISRGLMIYTSKLLPGWALNITSRQLITLLRRTLTSRTRLSRPPTWSPKMLSPLARQVTWSS